MTQHSQLRVGIIGAGNISEFHMRAIARIPTARIVGIVDRDVERAEALAKRWKVGFVSDEALDLFQRGVDVVHILTPPGSHAALARMSLEQGCHVYVEKPLATSEADCRQIAELAAEKQREVCVGHSFLRDPVFAKARKLIDDGVIGEPISAEYVRSTCYPGYRGGAIPEMYRAGGYPFRDMGVHGLYLIEGVLGQIDSAETSVRASGREPQLHCDEWSVLLRCQRGDATVKLSWNGRPQQHSLTVYGTRGVLRADMYGMCVSVKRVRRIPEHAARVINSVVEASQIFFGTLSGVTRFAIGRVKQYHGLQRLVQEFYRTLQRGDRAPVTPCQARSVVEWTEKIAAVGDAKKRSFLEQSCASPSAKVLVTGGTGFIGRHLVQRLLAQGERIRLLTRQIPHDPFIAGHKDVEVILGDLGDAEVVNRAVAGVAEIFHLGAAMSGRNEDFECGTIVGTRNVVEAALRHNVERLVYLSSLSVLQAPAAKQNIPLNEQSPLERSPELRGDYTRTKLAAEKIVQTAIQEDKLNAIILRPAEVLGDGPPRMTSGLALRVSGRLVVLGNGELRVPMVYVEDLVDAILLARASEIGSERIVHIVDNHSFTQNALIARYRSEHPEIRGVIHLPRWMVSLVGRCADVAGRLIRRTLPFCSYRLQSALTPRSFDCRLAKDRLGWSPRRGVDSVLQNLVSPTPSVASHSPFTLPRNLMSSELAVSPIQQKPEVRHPSTWELIRSDLLAKAKWRYRGTGWRNLLKTLVTDGTSAMLLYRLMQWSHRYRLWPLEMFFNKCNATFCHCVIGRGAEFGPGFVLNHSSGIVINGLVRAGAHVSLEHQVTIGAEQGCCPTLGSHVFIGAGAKIIGKVVVGDHVRIGANAVVIHDVPSNSTAVGVPARIVNRRNASSDGRIIPEFHNGSPAEPYLLKPEKAIRRH